MRIQGIAGLLTFLSCLLRYQESTHSSTVSEVALGLYLLGDLHAILSGALRPGIGVFIPLAGCSFVQPLAMGWALGYLACDAIEYIYMAIVATAISKGSNELLGDVYSSRVTLLFAVWIGPVIACGLCIASVSLVANRGPIKPVQPEGEALAPKAPASVPSGDVAFWRSLRHMTLGANLLTSKLPLARTAEDVSSILAGMRVHLAMPVRESEAVTLAELQSIDVDLPLHYNTVFKPAVNQIVAAIDGKDMDKLSVACRRLDDFNSWFRSVCDQKRQK